jgi:hypothetical protein
LKEQPVCVVDIVISQKTLLDETATIMDKPPAEMVNIPTLLEYLRSIKDHLTAVLYYLPTIVDVAVNYVDRALCWANFSGWVVEKQLNLRKLFQIEIFANTNSFSNSDYS